MSPFKLDTFKDLTTGIALGVLTEILVKDCTYLPRFNLIDFTLIVDRVYLMLVENK